MKKELKKLIILCGGTGGHFFPGLSVARLFKETGGQVCLVTGKHKANYGKEYSATYGINIHQVNSGKLSNNPFKMLMFCLKFISGFFQTIKIYLRERPDAVLAMGSYTSVPSGIAAVFMKIPLFLHDGNSVIGKANLFLLNWSKLIMTAFPPVNKGIDFSKVFVSGMPLRPELVKNSILKREKALEIFNSTFKRSFSIEKPIVLIFGGSLGAKAINSIIPESIKMCQDAKIQVIHLTGANNFESTLDSYKNTRLESLVLEKFDNMALLYIVSNLVICRSGGSTIAELDFFHKYAILLPFPHASDSHQLYNALYYERQGKAEIVEDKDFTTVLIADKIIKQLKCQMSCYEDSPNSKNPASVVIQKIMEFL